MDRHARTVAIIHQTWTQKHSLTRLLYEFEFVCHRLRGTKRQCPLNKKNIHPCPRYNEKSTFTAALRISKSYCLKLGLNLEALYMFTQLHRHMPIWLVTPAPMRGELVTCWIAPADSSQIWWERDNCSQSWDPYKGWKITDLRSSKESLSSSLFFSI